MKHERDTASDTTPAANDELLTPAKAMAIIGSSASTKQLGRWAARGLLAAVRTKGGHRRYTHASVVAFKERRLREGVDIDKAAEIVGVHPKTIEKWVRTGKLPGVRTDGRHIRIHPDDLMALPVMRDKANEPYLAILTTREVSQLYRVGINVVADWVAQGKLQARRVGDKGHWRIWQSELPEPFNTIDPKQVLLKPNELARRLGTSNAHYVPRWVVMHGLTRLRTPGGTSRYIQQEVDKILGPAQ